MKDPHIQLSIYWQSLVRSIPCSTSVRITIVTFLYCFSIISNFQEFFILILVLFDSLLLCKTSPSLRWDVHSRAHHHWTCGSGWYDSPFICSLPLSLSDIFLRICPLVLANWSGLELRNCGNNCPVNSARPYIMILVGSLCVGVAQIVWHQFFTSMGHFPHVLDQSDH
jgi:hypothetical protein